MCYTSYTMKRKTHYVAFRATPALHDAVKKLAQEDFVTVSEFIHARLDEYVSRRLKTETPVNPQGSYGT